MNKKIYCKRVECYDTTAYYNNLVYDITENAADSAFIVYDRRHGVNNELIKRLRDNIAEGSDYDVDVYYKNNFAAYIIDEVKPFKKINVRAALKIAAAVKKYDDRIINLHDFIVNALSAIYNKQFNYYVMRGTSQGEVSWLYYCSDKISTEYIYYIEAVIYGSGIEVMIHDHNTPPACADDIDGYCFYSYEYDIKRAAAQECGVDVADVVAYDIKSSYTVTHYIYEEVA